MSTRDDIAEAMRDAGFEISPYYRANTTPGSGWVRLERIDYPDSFGGVAFWNVLVLLPQDLAAAEQYLAESLPSIRAALKPHLVLTSVVPQRLDITGVGVLPCAFFNGHREAD